MSKYINEFPQHLVSPGVPAFNYRVYFGDPNQNPLTNPKTVYSDAGLTVPIAQPLILNSDGLYGQEVFLNGEYSIQINTPSTVANPNGVIWQSAPAITGIAGSLNTVSTVADAKASTNLLDGQGVYILGYYAAADGGGGMYVYDASSAATADDGTVLALDTLAGRLLYSDAAAITFKTFGAKCNGTHDDTTFTQQALTYLASTLGSIKGVGVTRITAPVTLSGGTLILEGEIKVDGADSSVFINGGVILENDSTIVGGVIYTSGAMTADLGTKVVDQIFGSLQGVTIYSQLDEVLRHSRGYVNVKMFGGRIRGMRSTLSTDEPTNFDIEYFNIGIAYTDKAIKTPIAIPPDSRAVNIQPTGDIFNPVNVNINGTYSWKNGAWIGYDVSGTLHNLKTSGQISRAGFYFDGASEQNGSGAGTAWELENCPYGVFTGSSSRVRGYNIAIVRGCDYAVDVGEHRGIGGDPCCVIVTSDNVVADGIYTDGTVGVSIGEDGAQADNTLITGKIINSRNEPVRISAAKNTRLIGASIIGEPSSTSTTGSWAGIGQLYPAIKALHQQYGAQDITIKGCIFHGYFTHEVIEDGFNDVGADNSLRVFTENNTYSCSIIPHTNQNLFNLIDPSLDGANKFTRVDTSSSTTGFASVGQVTLADNSTSLFLNINAALADLSAFQSGTETLAEALQGYDILWYLQYKSGFIRDSSRILRFGLTTSANASHAGVSFYAIFDAYEAILGRPLKSDEWIPLRANMHDVLYSLADPADIQYFMMSADDSARGYDYIITTPVIVPVGDKEIADY